MTVAPSTVTIDQLTDWLRRFQGLVAEHQTELTELDSVIGDADHGANMARGMTAVAAKLDAAEGDGDGPASVADLFKAVGMTLVTSVGGASGPLYGTFFLRFGMSAGAVTTLDAAGLGAALRAGLDGIVARGKAELGDKTMFDAMSPAVDAWDVSVAAGGSPADASAAALAAAEVGRDATVPLVARKGRASYLGERSAGHLDPGAASTTLLFRALADALGG
ncbi:dihydroxyacetone kinase DhaL subunit [Microbacterium sp. cf046]|uniref:dihydroxyacetone kinase subunit DhaL n=1 Tax=Microbacterium sp. cf046 TaxID=1761803 RepID=UPI0008E89B82|nr:dihydroxyacetone kinase subunit DhaL [Microbacterium sp. cf046]SFS00511.1 dihydroxyacetone kinase DhaL subunit [Microbacterium sp. cf046]